MASEYDNDLLREGIFHYKVKEFDTARAYIQRAWKCRRYANAGAGKLLSEFAKRRPRSETQVPRRDRGN